MDLFVRHGEREARVRIRRTGDSEYEVAVDDRVYRIDAVPAGTGVYSLRIDGAQHEVAVRRERDDRVRVSSAGTSWDVEVTDPLTHLARLAGDGPGRKRRERITAYMPGRVVSVLVEEGAEVTAGQGIVVLEAMKMQNEIRAEHDGVVKTLHVQPGQAVEGGDPLFEME